MIRRRASRRPSWSWPGVVALVLAVTVAGSYAAAVVITALQNGPVTPEGAALLDTLGGLLAGAIAGWLGGSIVERRLAERDDQDDDVGPDA